MAETKKSAMARIRPWLRAIHRDVGYIAVGLTFVYAISGLALNHIEDWRDGDASYRNYQRTHQVGRIDGPDEAVVDELRKKLAITSPPRDVFASDPDHLEITFDKRSLHYDRTSGEVVDDGQEPRFFLQIANWLHLNRGKRGWKYFSDAYAAGLLLLATSGVFMIAGKKGILGRGAVLVLLGILVPVIYVHFSGP